MQKNNGNVLMQAIFAFGILLFLFIILSPFLWQFITSIKPPKEIYKMPPEFWPHKLYWNNYFDIFVNYPFAQYLVNSLIVAGFTTLFCVAVASFSSYAVARLHMKGKGLFMMIVLATSMFPPVAVLSPLYLMMKSAGLLNTYVSLIIPYTTFALPLSIWNISTFFESIPYDLEDAAKIDGASPLQTFYRIILPLARPGIFTTAIIVFITAWNEFLFSLTFNTKELMRTVPVGISMFQGQYELPWGEMATATILVTIPLVIMVIVFQRNIISGLTAGSVKG